MKLGMEKTEYLLNADYSWDPMDFVDMKGSAAFAQAFGFDLEMMLGYLSMPYDSYDMMKWNIISYYENYVNSENFLFWIILTFFSNEITIWKCQNSNQ